MPRRRIPPDPWQRQFPPQTLAMPSGIRERIVAQFRPQTLAPLFPRAVPGVVPGVDEEEWPRTPRPRTPPPFNFATDPGYIAALAAEQTGRGSLDALLKQRRAEALIGFGDPEWAATSGFGLDPNAIEAVRAMHRSGNATLARLEKGRDLRRGALINRLVGSGLLFSGALGYGERENEAEFGRERFDAQQAVLGRLRGEQDRVVEQQQALRNAVIQSLQAAYTNYLQDPWLYAGVG